jgi:hypothetical protein
MGSCRGDPPSPPRRSAELPGHRGLPAQQRGPDALVCLRRSGELARHPGPRGLVIAGGPATGTVTGARPGSFTVMYPGGVRVRVTTSKSTTVLKQVGIGLDQLRTGTFTDAVGHLAARGTLAASAVEQGSMLAAVMPPAQRRLPRTTRGLASRLNSGRRCRCRWRRPRQSTAGQLDGRRRQHDRG